MRTFGSSIIALVFHLTGGWAWSIAGGVAAGWLTPRGGWWRGAVAVGAAWGIMVLYNIVAAYDAVWEMHRVVGQIAGGLPGWTIPVVSVLVGVVIGFGGGLVGSSIRRLTGFGPDQERKQSRTKSG